MRLPALELKEPTEFDDSLLLYWTAWQELSPSRQRSMGGPSGIPFSEVVAWMDERHMVGRDERDMLIALVQRLDGHYLAWVSKKLKETRHAR